MTSDRVIQLVRKYPTIRDARLNLETDDVLYPASWAQEEILRRVEPLITKNALSLVIGQEVYTSGDAAWLASAGRFLNTAFYTDTALKHLVKRDVGWVDRDRTRIAEGGTKSLPPRFFYILETNPKSIGLWYIPDAVYEINFRSFRRHAADDNLTKDAPAVNPLVPDDLEELLVLGTVYRIFDMRGRRYNDERDAAIKRYVSMLESKIEEYRIQNAAILVDDGLVFG